MNILKKVMPINQKGNAKRMKLEFDDNLIHFYYRYLFNSSYSVNRRDKDFFFDNFIKDDMDSYFIPHKFENISKEFLLKRNFAGRMDPIILDIGSYSFSDAKKKINREFDLVSLDKKGYISYECKYSNNAIDNRVIEEERQTAGLDIGFYKLGFISKRGFSPQVDKSKYNCFSLIDFYDF